MPVNLRSQRAFLANEINPFIPSDSPLDSNLIVNSKNTQPPRHLRRVSSLNGGQSSRTHHIEGGERANFRRAVFDSFARATSGGNSSRYRPREITSWRNFARPIVEVQEVSSRSLAAPRAERNPRKSEWRRSSFERKLPDTIIRHYPLRTAALQFRRETKRRASQKILSVAPPYIYVSTKRLRCKMKFSIPPLTENPSPTGEPHLKFCARADNTRLTRKVNTSRDGRQRAFSGGSRSNVTFGTNFS